MTYIPLLANLTHNKEEVIANLTLGQLVESGDSALLDGVINALCQIQTEIEVTNLPS